MMIIMKGKYYNIEVIEKDLKRVLSKTTWDKTIEIQGYLFIEKDDGDIEYKYMPKPLQAKVIRYIIDHPRSRLAKSFVKDENIRFGNKGYLKKELSFNELNRSLRGVLGMNYVEPYFIIDNVAKRAVYDFSVKTYGFKLLTWFIHDNPNNPISLCDFNKYENKRYEFVFKIK